MISVMTLNGSIDTEPRVLFPANVFNVPPVAEIELPDTDSMNTLALDGIVLPSIVIPPVRSRAHD